MPRLTIIRGLPGAGKSYYAKTHFGGALVLEGDQRFITPEGQYVFDATTRDRSYLTDMLKIAFIHDLQHVIVTTASSYAKSIQELVDVATKFGYETKVIWLDCCNGKATNIHGVSANVLARMRHSWQCYPGEVYMRREEIPWTDSAYQFVVAQTPPKWFSDNHKPCKVIFLDIDGVLNDNFGVDAYSGSFFPEKAEYLKSLVDHTKAKIVLHSSWGETKATSDQAARELERFGIELYDNVYKYDNEIWRTSDELAKTNRAALIKEWLEYHPEITNYVVLDDFDYSKEFGLNFVRTWGRDHFGFDLTDCTLAETILMSSTKEGGVKQ